MTTNPIIYTLARGARLARNIYMDLRFGGRFLGGEIKTPYVSLGAKDTASAHYSALDVIFKDRIGPTDVLVDVGCGKGRVINWWLHQGLKNRIYGLELDPPVARATSQRLRRYPNVTIVSGGAVENFPPDASLAYAFNPFMEEVMRKFKDKLAAMRTAPRQPLTLLYYNPSHLNVFEGDHRWRLEENFVVVPALAVDRLVQRHFRLAVLRLNGGGFEQGHL